MTCTDRLLLALLLARLRTWLDRSPLGRYRARYSYVPRNLFVPRHRYSYLGARNAA